MNLVRSRNYEWRRDIICFKNVKSGVGQLVNNDPLNCLREYFRVFWAEFVSNGWLKVFCKIELFFAVQCRRGR